jgi:hypothetical protein
VALGAMVLLMNIVHIIIDASSPQQQQKQQQQHRQQSRLYSKKLGLKIMRNLLLQDKGERKTTKLQFIPL